MYNHFLFLTVLKAKVSAVMVKTSVLVNPLKAGSLRSICLVYNESVVE